MKIKDVTQWEPNVLLLLALILLASWVSLEKAQNAPSAGAPSTPMVIALTPVGQKTFENIQLRFQLLQRDVADLERSELEAHPEISSKDYRLDTNRGQLVRVTPVPKAEEPKPPAKTAPLPLPHPEEKK